MANRSQKIGFCGGANWGLLLLKLDLFLFYVHGVLPAYMSVQHRNAVPAAARGGARVLWKWNYRWL